MKVIGITGQKGGSGKTTLTVNLAVWLTKKGFKVSVLDRDPQAAVSHWHDRGEGLPFAIHSDLEAKLGSAIATRKRAGDDIVIVDTAPSIGGAFTEIPLYADLILLPSTPSGTDVDALYTSFEQMKEKYHHENVGAVLTQVFTAYKITKEAIKGLKDLGIPLHAQIGHRVVYQTTGTNGNTVFSVGHPKATKEIEQLGKKILSLTNLKAPR